MMIVVMVRIRMRKFEFLITSTIILLYVSVKAMNWGRLMITLELTKKQRNGHINGNTASGSPLPSIPNYKRRLMRGSCRFKITNPTGTNHTSLSLSHITRLPRQIFLKLLRFRLMPVGRSTRANQRCPSEWLARLSRCITFTPQLPCFSLPVSLRPASFQRNVDEIQISLSIGKFVSSLAISCSKVQIGPQQPRGELQRINNNAWRVEK